jgi:hypothetical protein
LEVRNLKLLNKNVMAALAVAVALFVVVGSGVALSAYADKEDRGNGWPKTAYWIPRSSLEQGNTIGLTIAQCDSPEQCKEVNGTPSPNTAAKKQCEEFSGEKCVRISGIP